MNTWQKRTILDPRTWLPQGGDGTDVGDVEDTTGADQNDDTTTDTDTDASGDTGDTGAVSKEAHDALQAKFTQLKAMLQAADRNKSAAQQKLDELTRKEKTDLENAQADAAKAAEEATGWREKYTTLALTNAFLIASAQNKITWHDPEVAQRAANMKDLTVDDTDGSVEGMAAVIKTLAKEKPFLVNSSSGTDTGADDGKAKNGTRSGSLVGSGGKDKGKPGQLSDIELKKRFPALRD